MNSFSWLILNIIVCGCLMVAIREFIPSAYPYLGMLVVVAHIVGVMNPPNWVD